MLFSMTSTIIDVEWEWEKKSKGVTLLFGKIRKGFTEEVTFEWGPEEWIEIQQANKKGMNLHLCGQHMQNSGRGPQIGGDGQSRWASCVFTLWFYRLDCNPLTWDY